MHQQEVYRKIMLKHWQRVVRIAVALNIKALTHPRQVSLNISFALSVLSTFSISAISCEFNGFFEFPEKVSLLSRLFRRSGRSKQRQIETYSAQFPPAEWFNSKAVHLHSVGTQTSDLVSNADIKSDEVCFGKFGEFFFAVHINLTNMMNQTFLISGCSRCSYTIEVDIL